MGGSKFFGAQLILGSPSVSGVLFPRDGQVVALAEQPVRVVQPVPERGALQARAALAVQVFRAELFPAQAGAARREPGAPLVVELVLAPEQRGVIEERVGPAAGLPDAAPVEPA